MVGCTFEVGPHFELAHRSWTWIDSSYQCSYCDRFFTEKLSFSNQYEAQWFIWPLNTTFPHLRRDNVFRVGVKIMSGDENVVRERPTSLWMNEWKCIWVQRRLCVAGFPSYSNICPKVALILILFALNCLNWLNGETKSYFISHSVIALLHWWIDGRQENRQFKWHHVLVADKLEQFSVYEWN